MILKYLWYFRSLFCGKSSKWTFDDATSTYGPSLLFRSRRLLGFLPRMSSRPWGGGGQSVSSRFFGFEIRTRRRRQGLFCLPCGAAPRPASHLGFRRKKAKMRWKRKTSSGAKWVTRLAILCSAPTPWRPALSCWRQQRAAQKYFVTVFKFQFGFRCSLYRWLKRKLKWRWS